MLIASTGSVRSVQCSPSIRVDKRVGQTRKIDIRSPNRKSGNKISVFISKYECYFFGRAFLIRTWLPAVLRVQFNRLTKCDLVSKLISLLFGCIFFKCSAYDSIEYCIFVIAFALICLLPSMRDNRRRWAKQSKKVKNKMQNKNQIWKAAQRNTNISLLKMQLIPLRCSMLVHLGRVENWFFKGRKKAVGPWIAYHLLLNGMRNTKSCKHWNKSSETFSFFANFNQANCDLINNGFRICVRYVVVLLIRFFEHMHIAHTKTLTEVELSPGKHPITIHRAAFESHDSFSLFISISASRGARMHFHRDIECPAWRVHTT